MIVTDLEILRRPCEPVKSLREGQEIARKLQAELERHNKRATKKYQKATRRKQEDDPSPSLVLGLGLAAPQIGIAKRVCVVLVNGVAIALMNPVIVERSEASISFEESCLSLPDMKVRTRRSLWVEVDTLNVGRKTFGPKDKFEFTINDVLESVVTQHELDHTNSILITDYQKGAEHHDSTCDGTGM